MTVSTRSIALGATALTLFIWVHYASVWWIHLEGDSPLYPLMSYRIVTEGKHYVMTAGQAHGGTLLVYLRALLFKIFGISHFIGFYVNGLAVAAGVGLWTRFACRISGNFGGIVMGALGAVASERVVRAACTDYFAITLVTGGLMLNFAEALARRPQIRKQDAFVAGLLLGISWYLCRFSALYAVGATLFFLALLPSVRRRVFVPSKKELWQGKVAKMLTSATFGGVFLTFMGFATSDRFLGVNAESNLKITVVLAAATLSWLRWRIAVFAGPALGLAACGAVVGMLPELIFKWMVPHKTDRVTGLVRWGDIAPWLPEIPERIGVNFSFHYPLSFGLTAAIAALGLVILGWFTDKRERYYAVLGLVLICVGAWFGVHTYMHLAPQYFFVAMFPLYLAAGFAARRSRFRVASSFLCSIILIAGIADIGRNMTIPNEYQESGILKLFEEWHGTWGVSIGFGHLNSDYNLMWAAQGKVILPYMDEDERFKDWQDLAKSKDRILCVHHELDRQPLWRHEGYRRLDHKALENGFEAMVLEKIKRSD